MLLQTIQQIKTFGSPNVSLSILSIQPYIHQAEQDHLIPFVSQELYNRLEPHVAPDDGSAGEKALIEQMQRVVAPIALYYYTAENEVSISDSGIKRQETESEKTAYNNQVIRLRSSLLNRGLSALDRVLDFLQKNKNDWSEWANSEQYSFYNSLMIRSGAELKKYYGNLRYPHQFYACAAPLMEVVERLYILPHFGDSFTALKEKQAANNPGTDEKVAIATISKSIAYLTICKVVNELQVRIDSNGLSILTSSADSDQDDVSKRTAATGNQVSALQRQCESIGLEYIDAMRDYLNSKASAILFPEWKAKMDAASANPQPVIDMNQQITGAFSLI